ncbi:unnamed protein product [Menidia menidia]|uniref:(Atlantic silverside) hypothetical protein n=1 Tax=Menidia menidia TaxID=238744 RepID=A0A8S4BLK7_9TELE|nr:unnamed protein product [Menidia menidia]
MKRQAVAFSLVITAVPYNVTFHDTTKDKKAEDGERGIRPHIQIQASTPSLQFPPPSVHVPLPATPQQQGPEPLQRSQSITERERETEKGSKNRERTGQTGDDDDDDSHQGCSSLPSVHPNVKVKEAGVGN